MTPEEELILNKFRGELETLCKENLVSRVQQIKILHIFRYFETKCLCYLEGI